MTLPPQIARLEGLTPEGAERPRLRTPDERRRDDIATQILDGGRIPAGATGAGIPTGLPQFTPGMFTGAPMVAPPPGVHDTPLWQELNALALLHYGSVLAGRDTLARDTADFLYNAVQEYPQLQQWLDDDFQRGLHTAEAVGVVQRFLSPETEALYEAAYELVNEVGYLRYSMAELAREPDAYAEYDGIITGHDNPDFLRSMLSEDATVVTAREIRERMIREGSSAFPFGMSKFEAELRGLPIPELAGSFNRLRGRPVDFVVAGDRIAFAITSGEGDTLIDIQLDPGVPAPNDLVGAVAELMLAARGERNRVLRRSGTLPGQQHLLGAVWEGIGDLTYRGPLGAWKDSNDAWLNAVVSVTTGGEWDPRNSHQIVAEDARRRAANTLELRGPNDLILAVTQGVAAENEIRRLGMTNLEVARAGLDVLSGLGTDELQTLTGDVENVRSQVLEEIARDLEDDRHSAKRFLDDQIITPIATAAATWDRFTQRVFVAAADFFGDLGEGVWGLATDPTDGWNAFVEAFEFDAGRIDTASDYFGGGEFTNFIAGMLGDPFIWFTPGGKGLAQQWRRHMSTKAGAVDLIRQPQMAHILQQMSDDLMGTTTRFLDEGLGVAPRVREINKLAALDRLDGLSTQAVRDITRSSGTVDDISRIIQRDYTDGLGVFAPNGHPVLRSTTQLVRNLAGTNDSRFRAFVARNLGSWEGDRVVQASGSGFLDDALDLVRHLNYSGSIDTATANRWVDEALEAMDAFDGNRGAYTAALLDRATEMKRQIGEITARTNAQYADMGLRIGNRTNAQNALATAEKTRLRITEIRDMGDGIDEALVRELDLLENGPGIIGPLTRERRNARAQLRRAIRSNNEGAYTRALRRFNEADDARRVTNTELARLRGAGYTPGSGGEALDELERLVKAADLERRTLRARMRRYTHLAETAADTSDNGPLVRWYALIMDDWGRRNGLDEIPGIHNINTLLPDRQKLDWAKVAGGPAQRWTEDADQWLKFVLGPEDSELIGRMEGIGFHGTSLSYLLPVSPKHLIAYEARHSDTAWNEFLDFLGKARLDRVAKRSRQAGQILRTQFTAGVLLNIRTMLRSNLDEPIRHAIATGRFFGGREGIHGITAAGEPVMGHIPGPLSQGARRITGGPIDVAARRLGKESPTARWLSDEAQLFARPRMQPWRWVDWGDAELIAPTGARAKELMEGLWKGHEIRNAAGSEFIEASSQIYNGLLGQMDLIKYWAAARQTGDTTAFRRWWAAKGSRRASSTIRVHGISTETNYLRVLETLDEWMDEWVLSSVREASRDRTREALIRAWATGSPIEGATLRQLGPVPSMRSGGIGKTGAFKWQENMFDVMYGRGSEIGGGFIFMDNYDMLMNTLMERHGPNGTGRLLTKERLVEVSETPITLEQAQQMLQEVSPYIDELVRNHGFYTPRQLNMVARRMAGRVADHHMYHIGATSLLGDRVRNIYPFGPAQFDFMEWYGRELTKPLEVGLNPTIQQAFRKMGLGNLVEETIPFMGRPIQPGFWGRDIPLNLRLAARIADITGYAAAFAGRQELLPDLESPVLELLNHATFMPLEFDDAFLIDFVPGMGPVWSFWLHMMPVANESEDHPMHNTLAAIRRFVEATNPAFAFNDRQFGTGGWRDLGSLFTDFVYPSSSRSTRRTLRDLWFGLQTALSETTGMDPRTLAFDTRPTNYNLYLRGALGRALADNPNLVADRGVEAFTQMVDDAAISSFNQSAANAVQDLGVQTVTDMLGGIDFLGSVNVDEYLGWLQEDPTAYPLHLYQGVIDDLDRLHGYGWISDVMFDDISTTWAAFKAGNADRADITFLSNQLGSLLFDSDDTVEEYLIAWHPEIAAIGTSQYQCDEDAPYQYCSGETRQLRLPINDPDERRRVFDQGRREGWIVPKSDTDFAVDMWRRYTQKMWRYTSRLWSQMTGRNQFSNRFDDSTPIRLSVVDQRALEGIGIDLSRDTTVGALSLGIRAWRDQHSANYVYSSTAGTAADTEIAQRNHGAYQDLQDILRGTSMLIRDRYSTDPNVDPERPSTWPEDFKGLIRAFYEQYVNLGYLGPNGRELYERNLSGRFGSLDYEPPEPPGPDATPTFTMHPADVTVVDGDTVAVEMADGEEVRIRLIGVNATDRNSANPDEYYAYRQQKGKLIGVLDMAIARGWDVSFVYGDPDRFNLIQEVDPRTNKQRFVMWMLVDGQAVYDPTVFTSRNPAGITLGGEGVPDSWFEEVSNG